MAERIDLVSKNDVRAVSAVFADSADYSSGWDMYDTAVEYFGTRYLESLVDSVSHRETHSELLSQFSHDEAQARADMYEQLVPRVVLARQILEAKVPELLQLMLDKQYSGRVDYVEVLADVLARTSTWHLVSDLESDNFWHDCYSTVQWLRGWVESERVDQQG